MMPQSSKRQRTIQTSTPVSKQFGAREVVLIPDEDSPIKTEEEESTGGIEEGKTNHPILGLVSLMIYAALESLLLRLNHQVLRGGDYLP